MVPPNLHGAIKSVVSDGKYNITQTLAVLTLFISVALSLESPPPDVIWHPAL